MGPKVLMGLLLMFMAVGCRSDHVNIAVNFDSLNGLQHNDRVLFEDNPAGMVGQVEYLANGTYTARIEVDKGFANALTEYSRFRIVADPDRIGHKAVQIELPRTGGRLLSENAEVTGISSPAGRSAQLKKDLEAGLEFFKEQVERLAHEVQQIPQSDAYQRLKRSLGELAEEIGRSEEKTRQKIKQEWLPQIEKELEALKRRLHELGREEEVRPLEDELNRIRKI